MIEVQVPAFCGVSPLISETFHVTCGLGTEASKAAATSNLGDTDLHLLASYFPSYIAQTKKASDAGCCRRHLAAALPRNVQLTQRVPVLSSPWACLERKLTLWASLGADSDEDYCSSLDQSDDNDCVPARKYGPVHRRKNYDAAPL